MSAFAPPPASGGGDFLSLLRRLAAPVLDLLFPPRCPACGAYAVRRGGWCPACLAAAVRVRRLPLSAAHRAALGGAWALGAYEGALRRLLLDLKFRGRRSALPALRAFLFAACGALPRADWMPGLAVPVPLFPAKEKRRGYNQTELIFRDWLLASGWTWRRALIRTRATAPQFGLDAAARAANVRDAFALAPGFSRASLAGRPVLLVDDILTTGETLAACARVLRASGAADVAAWTLASGRD